MRRGVLYIVTMKSILCKFLLAGQLALIGNMCAAQPELFIFNDEPVTDSRNYFWDQMNVVERAALWPVLTQEQRLTHWRFMNKSERSALRNTLRPYGGFKLHLQCTGHRLTQTGSIDEMLQMTQEQLSLLRRQVHRVSVELRDGIPFECSDPRNCSSSLIRFIDD